MKNNINRGCRMALLSAAAFTLYALPVSGFAQPPTSPRVIYPNNSKAETGMTYEEWSVLWWQYVFAQPAVSNPTLDASGKDCAAGQEGVSPVFFLAGSGASNPVTRSCTVPEGKKLFLPLVNAYDFHAFPNDGLNTPAALWKDIYTLYKLAGPKGPIKFTDFYVRVNGVDIAIFKGESARSWSYACAGQDQPGGRSCASTFGLNLPVGNIFAETYGLAPGVYTPAVAEGHYVMLESLTVGAHTIEFGGAVENADGSKFSQSLTYNIHVKPNSSVPVPPKVKRKDHYRR